MRTTLIIADPVYERAQNTARQTNKRLSNLVTEAIEAYLLRIDIEKASPGVRHRLRAYSMGRALADVNNRDALQRQMED